MSSSESDDDAVKQILSTYHSLKFNPPPLQYTILASFYLTSSTSGTLKVLSIATGTKCLPAIRFPARGEALHDSHAEVLARRGAIRWFLEQIAADNNPTSESSSSNQWITRRSEDGKYVLRNDFRLNLYVSTPPCGDASMRYLAAFQDPEMAALKDSSVRLPSDSSLASRGRDNYSLYGVLRTKPGRADSPPALSMSCSDKIASWNVLGIQGALAARFLAPLYISEVVIGEVPQEMQETVREDCERAFWRRLEGIQGLTGEYSLHRPNIKFTTTPFAHSRTVLSSVQAVNGSSNESLSWYADSDEPRQVLINGFKRGVSPKHRWRDKSRPLLCKVAMFQLHNRLVSLLDTRSADLNSSSYFAVKLMSAEYQQAKEALKGQSGPFCGWVRSGQQWENFDSFGEQLETIETPPSITGIELPNRNRS